MPAYSFSSYTTHSGEKIEGYDFDPEEAVSEMMAEGVLFLGRADTPFFEGGPPSPATLWINCNDLWVWALADATPLFYEDIESLYVTSCAPGQFSVSKWICKRLGRRPMPEIIYDMRTAGVWDDEMEALPIPAQTKE